MKKIIYMCWNYTKSIHGKNEHLEHNCITSCRSLNQLRGHFYLNFLRLKLVYVFTFINELWPSVLRTTKISVLAHLFIIYYFMISGAHPCRKNTVTNLTDHSVLWLSGERFVFFLLLTFLAIFLSATYFQSDSKLTLKDIAGELNILMLIYLG